MSLSKDVQAAIKKNLPAEVADSLKEYLQECEDLRAENEQLKDFNKKANDQNAKYVEENLKLATDLKRHADLDQREKSLREMENRLAVLIANEKQQAAERRADDIFRLAETVFRNPLVKRTVFENDQFRTDYANGQQVMTKSGTTTTEEVTEQ